MIGRKTGCGFFLAFCFAAGTLAPPAAAQQNERKATVSVEQPWARATPPSAKTGAVFLTIRNSGTAADRLLSASSDAAEAVELHAHIHEGNIMRMRKVEAVPIPAGEATKFAPGGLHVMLIGLRAPLKQGGHVDLALTFETAGKIAVSAPILGIGALGPRPDAGRGHSGH